MPLHDPIDRLDLVLAEGIAAACMLWAACSFIGNPAPPPDAARFMLFHLVPGPQLAALCLIVGMGHVVGITLYALHRAVTISYVLRLTALGFSTVFFAGLGAAELTLDRYSVIAAPSIGLGLRCLWTIWRMIFETGRG